MQARTRNRQPQHQQQGETKQQHTHNTNDGRHAVVIAAATIDRLSVGVAVARHRPESEDPRAHFMEQVIAQKWRHSTPLNSDKDHITKAAATRAEANACSCSAFRQSSRHKAAITKGTKMPSTVGDPPWMNQGDAPISRGAATATERTFRLVRVAAVLPPYSYAFDP